QRSGMSVCSGGIIGMGESVDDRLRMLEVLSEFDPQPESVPINCLLAMPGTPLADAAPVDIFELVRLIAVARIAIPRARVRLAAGRRHARSWSLIRKSGFQLAAVIIGALPRHF